LPDIDFPSFCRFQREWGRKMQDQSKPSGFGQAILCALAVMAALAVLAGVGWLLCCLVVEQFGMHWPDMLRCLGAR
jgi:hypothetical protein